MPAEKRKIIIIPGFGESESEEAYIQLKEDIQSYSGSIVEFYNPIWDRRTVRHWINDFKNKFKDVDLSQFTVIGFSMGAYITLALTKEKKFKKINMEVQLKWLKVEQ